MLWTRPCKRDLCNEMSPMNKKLCYEISPIQEIYVMANAL